MKSIRLTWEEEEEEEEEDAGRGREDGGRRGMYGRSESQGNLARKTCSASRTGFFVSGVAGPYFSRYNDVLVFPPKAAVPLRVSLYRTKASPAMLLCVAVALVPVQYVCVLSLALIIRFFFLLQGNWYFFLGLVESVKMDVC